MSDSNLVEVARYRVIFADCDPMRIMYYGNYFRLFEIGRAELFRALGPSVSRVHRAGPYLGVIETHCRYLKPARYDDDLVIRAGVTEVGGRASRSATRCTGPTVTVGASGTHAPWRCSTTPAARNASRPEFREAVIRHTKCEA